jgi:hypothetical protein
VIIGDIDKVPTHCPPRYFPLLLTNDSLIDHFQHVSMDLSPSHYDVGPPLDPTIVFLKHFYSNYEARYQ